MKFKLVFVCLLFSLISCGEDKNCFEKGDKSVVQKCINKILETNEGKEIKDCYLVRPYLDTLSLSSYSEAELKTLLDNSKVNSDELSEIRKDIKLNCQNFYSEDLSNLSICKASHTIFSTTKIYDNLIQIRLVDHYESITKDQVKDKFEVRPNQIFEYIFVIRENGNADILLQSGTFYD